MSDSVTENFFGKLRHIASKLEKETKHLEYKFNREDPDSDDNDDSPMTVLHEINTEIRTLKGEIQVSVDGACSKEQDLVEFVKACKLLKQRTKSDLEQITDVFEKYGYKPPEAEHSEQGMNDLQVNLPGENADDLPDKEQTEELSIKPGSEKVPAAGNFLQLPKLSDFGLSQYQFCATWGPQGDKGVKTKGARKDELKTRTIGKKDSSSEPKDMSDILVLSKPKTPKWASRDDDDDSYSPRFQQYGMHDDYTMALFNLKAPAKSSVPQKDGDEGKMAAVPEKIVPVVSSSATSPVHQPDSNENIYSPSPPTFLTPGLKTAKQQARELVASSAVEEPESSPGILTPPRPQFETQWLKKLASENPGSMKAEVSLRDNMSSMAHSEEANKPASTFCHTFSENTVRLPSPPKITDFDDFLLTPQHPVLMSLTNDFQILKPSFF